MASCKPNVVYQTGIITTVAGVPILLCKAGGGGTEILEVAIQNINDTAVTGNLQLFEGQPHFANDNIQGNPISLQIMVQQFQLWSKTGKVVYDDLYLVDLVGDVTYSYEVRSHPQS